MTHQAVGVGEGGVGQREGVRIWNIVFKMKEEVQSI
jgi:hypothetical protein